MPTLSTSEGGLGGQKRRRNAPAGPFALFSKGTDGALAPQFAAKLEAWTDRSRRRVELPLEPAGDGLDQSITVCL